MPRPTRTSRSVSRAGVALLAGGLVAGLSVAQAGAVSAEPTENPTATAAKYNYFDSDFILRLRAAAIEPEADIPKPLVTGIGYSAVNLEKDIGGPLADCEIFGAGYYLTDVVEQGVLENSGPPDAGNKGGGIFNPTQSKDTKPNLSPGENLNNRAPQIRDTIDGHVIYELPHDGNGVRWQADCTDDAGGKATGNNLDLAGAEGVGSTTTGKVDKKTGEYVGISRAYIAALNTGTATLDAISSIMQVKHLPGQKPTVTYRIGISGGTLAEGADIPYGDLTKQFNEQVTKNSTALAALGTFGITLLGPTESVSENGGRYIINAPFLELQAGLISRKGTVGENQRLRLVNIDFEGLYQGGALKEPGQAGF